MPSTMYKVILKILSHQLLLSSYANFTCQRAFHQQPSKRKKQTNKKTGNKAKRISLVYLLLSSPLPYLLIIWMSIYLIRVLYFKVICAFKLSIIGLISTANTEATKFLRTDKRPVT